jgi:hypothetical protein
MAQMSKRENDLNINNLNEKMGMNDKWLQFKLHKVNDLKVKHS